MINIPSTAIGFDHIEPNLAIQVEKNKEALEKIMNVLEIDHDPEISPGYSLDGKTYRNLQNEVVHQAQIISEIGLDIQVYVVPLLQRIAELEQQIRDLQDYINELEGIIRDLNDLIDLLNRKIAILIENSGNELLTNSDVYLMNLGYLEILLGNTLFDDNMSDYIAEFIKINGGELNG